MVSNNSLITVYRVVDKNGLGMYGGQQLLQSLWDEACSGAYHRCHVMPCDDGLTNIPWSWKFAFKDSEQLNNWIYKKEWKDAIENLGGKVLLLLIPYESVWEGGHQVIYDPYEVVESLETSILEV